MALVFVLNGLLFASLASRIPDLRKGLDLSNSQLGLLLLAIAAGSVLALPSAGWLVRRSSAAAVVRLGARLCFVGLVLAAVGAALASAALITALGLFLYGIGTGVWDVAMNVEGTEVERGLGRSILPRFHAGWSLGGILGAGLGIAATAAGVSMVWHLAVVAAVSLVLAQWGCSAFLPATAHPEPDQRPGTAWREPRTLAIGVMVLCFSIAEGAANDWLSLALIDGYDVEQWVAVAGFTTFVCAMTAGRLVGPVVLDRFGRAPVLWASAAAAAAGILMVVAGAAVVPDALAVVVGVVLWGLGAALGFPVGISAAADEPARAAARVSVVSTIGYGAFLAGPPMLGALGDQVGTLDSLLLVAVLMVPAAVMVTAARPTRLAV